jgi:ribosomal protein S18 acetylase RimI-like enzyme
MVYRSFLRDYDDEPIIRCCPNFTLDEQRLLRNDCGDPGVSWEIMEQDDKLIAFCAYGLADCSLDSWLIYWIGVDSTARRCGNGRRILQEVERNIWYIRGGKRIFLETSSKDENRDVRNFYLRNGYTDCAIIKDFYSEGDDKVVYWKKL